MPSEKVLEQKKQLVAELTERIQKSTAGVIVDYKGISVADDTKLRKELREAGVEYSVVKNTLLKFALDNAKLSGLDHVLEGTTAIATSAEDAVAPARILAKYAEDKTVTFALKAGYVDDSVFTADEVLALAKLPPKEVLVAQALAGLNAPITGFACVLNATITGLVRALDAVCQKQSA